MEKYSLSSLAVTRVLLCLNCIRKQSLSAIRTQYKKLYPPSVHENAHAVYERYDDIEHILSFLVDTQLVWAEIASTPSTSHGVEKVYILSTVGAQRMRKKK